MSIHFARSYGDLPGEIFDVGWEAVDNVLDEGGDFEHLVDFYFGVAGVGVDYFVFVGAAASAATTATSASMLILKNLAAKLAFGEESAVSTVVNVVW